MWKIAAFRGSSYIYEDSSMRIGLQIPKNQKSFSDGSNLEITLAIMSKVINPLEITLQCKGGINMHIELKDKDFTIEPVSRKILKINFSLKSETYAFPSLQMKHREVNSGPLSKGSVSTQITLPLIFNYFLKDAKLTKKILEEAVISASGTYL